jgi:hypothetical protein
MKDSRAVRGLWQKLRHVLKDRASRFHILFYYSGVEGRHCPGLKGFYFISGSGHFLHRWCGLTDTIYYNGKMYHVYACLTVVN